MKKLLVFLIILLAAGGGFIAMRGCSGEARQARFLESADEYFEAGKYEEALLEYMNLLRLDNQNIHALDRLGAIWMKRGAPLRALPFLNEVVRLNDAAQRPTPADARLRRAEALLSLRQLQPAHEEALRALDQEPTNADALLIVVNCSGTKEMLAEAQRRLDAFDLETSGQANLAKAILASRLNDEAAMEASLARAAELAPDSVDVQLAFSTLHQARNEVEKLGAALKKAAELSGPRSSARLRYATHLAQTGKADAAIRLLEGVVAEADDYLPAWIQLAEQLSAKGEHDEALDKLTEVFRRDPKNLSALTIKAQVLLAKGDTEKAREVYEQIDTDYKGLPKVKCNLARLYLQNGDSQGAEAALSQVLAQYPGYPEATILLAQIQLRNGKPIEAEVMLTELTQRQPGLVQAELMLSQAYLMQNRIDAAIDVFQRQIAKNPESPGPHFMLGRLYRQQERPDEALVELEAAQRLAPEDQTITFELVDFDIARGDFEAAHRRVQEHLDRKPDWGALYLKGRVLSAEEKWDEAEKVLQQALEQKPGSLTVYNLLVSNYLATQKPPEAIRELERCIAENPQSIQHRMLLGLLNQEQGDNDAAIAAYEGLLEVDPQFIPALNNLAYRYAERPDMLPKAIELAQRARSLEPQDPAVADTLGWVLYRSGDYQRALGLLEEAAEKLPDNPEAHYHLGFARYRMNLPEAARSALTTAVKGDEAYQGREQAAELLATLGGALADTAAQNIEQLEGLLAERPDDPVIHIRLARLREEKGDASKAEEHYQAALKLNPQLTDALKGMARLKLTADPGQALPFIERARAINRTDPEAVGLQGRVAVAQRNYPYAYGLLREALRSRAGDLALQRDFARAAYFTGKPDEARTAMKKVQASPDPAAAGEASTFLALTDPAPAAAAARAAVAEEQLKSDPENVPALMARAAGQEPSAAGATYQAILGRLPDFPLAQQQLVALYAADPATLGDPTRLAQAYSLGMKARNALPGDPSVARSLGILACRRGENDFAVQLLTESQRKAPLDATALCHLGLAQFRAGDTDAGKANLDKALEGNLSPALAAEAKAAMDLR